MRVPFQAVLSKKSENRSMTMQRKILPTLIFCTILLGGAFYYSRHSEEFHLITSVSIGTVVVTSLLKLCIIFLHSLEVKILTDHYDLNLHFLQWFGLSRMTALSRQLLPLGAGTSLKAVYLHRFHNLRYSAFIALTTIATLIRLMLTSLVAMVLLILAGREVACLFVIVGVVFAGALAFLVLGHLIPKRYLPFADNLANLVMDWRMIRADRGLIWKLMLLNCIIFVCSSLAVFFSFQAFSISASLVSSGIIAALTTLSGMLKLIPANLGINEAVFAALSAIYGTGVNEGLHAAALHRIIGTVFTLLIAPGFAYRLTKEALPQKKDAQD